jgi:two-component system CheB/CheR fusion protein
MLGGAETVGPHADMFSLLEKRQRVYTKKLAALRSDMQFAPPGHGLHEERAHRPIQAVKSSNTVQNEANRFILERYSPPAVVVDNDLHIVYFRGQTGRYLEPAPGEATLDLLKMAREGLLHGLRSALAEVRRAGARARRDGLRVKYNDEVAEVSVEVLPIEGLAEGRHFLILFEETPQKLRPQARTPAPRKRQGKGADSHLAKIEKELAASREYLQSIIQDLEAANEELQSANEEILSSNEELQSTNEELDTAKEELQSSNEELNTVNEELHNRNEELSRSNSDLLNLLGSVHIAIVMVASDLRIRRFTPMAEKVLNLIPSDIGRRISDIKPNIDSPNLERLITDAVDSVTTVEREVRDRQGTVYSLRIRPYKSAENRIDGAILALFDIDGARRNHGMDGGEPISAAIIDGVSDPLLLLDAQLRVKHANAAFLQQWSLRPEDTINRTIYDVGAGRWDQSALHLHLNEVLSGAKVVQDWRMRTDGIGSTDGEVLVTARRIPTGNGGLAAVLLRLVTQHSSG